MTAQYTMAAMKREHKTSAVCLIALLPCLAGCRSSASRSMIAVIPRDTAQEIWVSEHGGAADEALARHLTVYWNGPSRDDDVEDQIALSEKAIADHYYGLILSPNNSFALNATVQRAVSHGIPVVIVGSQVPIPPEPGLTFVLNDSEKMGALAAERIRGILGQKGKVVVIGVDSLSPGSMERSNGFEEAMQREAPGITIEQKLVGPFRFDQAELAAEQAIRAHPDLDALVTLGINETRGALAAVRNTGTSKRIKIVGCDQTLDLLFLLRRGDIDALVVEDTRTMGRIAVEEIDEERHGRQVAPRILVEPVLVTPSNVDDASIQQILSLRWRTTQ